MRAPNKSVGTRGRAPAPYTRRGWKGEVGGTQKAPEIRNRTGIEWKRMLGNKDAPFARRLRDIWEQLGSYTHNRAMSRNATLEEARPISRPATMGSCKAPPMEGYPLKALQIKRVHPATWFRRSAHDQQDALRKRGGRRSANEDPSFSRERTLRRAR